MAQAKTLKEAGQRVIQRIKTLREEKPDVYKRIVEKAYEEVFPLEKRKG